MSVQAFNGKITLSSVGLLEVSTVPGSYTAWTGSFSFTDNSGKYLANEAIVGDIIVLDTSGLDISTITSYVIESFETKTFNSFRATISYLDSNNNPAGPPDLNGAVDQPGVVSRRSPVHNLATLPSPGVQQLPDTFPTQLGNDNAFNVIDSQLLTIGPSGYSIDRDTQVTGVLGAAALTSTGAIAAVGPVSGANLSGTNTGDETGSSIKAKLGIATLSGINTGDQTIELSGDATGTGTGSIDVTLATVNTTPQTLAFHKITVNGKGLVTSTAAVNSVDLTAVLGYTPYPSSNPAGYLTTAPSSPVTSVAGKIGDVTLTKTDVGLNNADNTSDPNKPISIAVAAALADKQDTLMYTPANKAGDTFTGEVLLSANPTQALGAVTKQYADNIAAGLKVKESVETTTEAPLAACSYNNGTAGIGATLIASSNGALGTVGGFAGYLAGDRILVKNQSLASQNGIYVVTAIGSGGAPWVLTRAPDNDSTTELNSGDFTYVKNGNLGGTQWVMNTNDVVSVGSSTITWTQLSGAASLTAGAGISVAGNAIANTGVLRNVAGANISVSSATGNVTIAVTGTVPTATHATHLSGGTGGVLPYQSASGSTAFIAAGTAGQVLTSNGTAAPYWTANTGGTAEALGGVTINPNVVNSSLSTFGAVSKINFGGGTPTSGPGIWGNAGTVGLRVGTGGLTIYGEDGTTTLFSVSNYFNQCTIPGTIYGSLFIGNVQGNATTASTATSATTAVTATTATNLVGGTAGKIPFQSAPGITSYVAVGNVGDVLTSNGTGAPTWAAGGTVDASLLTGTTLASNIVNSSLQTTGDLKTVSLSAFGGVEPSNVGLWYDPAGVQIKINGSGFKIKTGASTYFTLTPSTGLALFSNSVQAYSFIGNLQGNATTATTATTATNATNAVNATNATNLAGGAAGRIPFQTAVGATSYVAVGNVGDVLTSNGTGAPTWAAGGTVDASLLSGTTIASTVVNSSLTTLGAVKTINLSPFAGIEPTYTGIWYNASGVQVKINGAGFKIATGTGNTPYFSINASSGLALFSNNVQAVNFVGNLQGNATTATTATTATNATNADNATLAARLAGGTGGTLVYQSGVNNTNFLPQGTTGQVLLSRGPGLLPPTWGDPALATTATNIAGGSVGRIAYQTAAGTTAFLPLGASGQVLIANGTTAPTWGTIASVNTASDLAGGTAGSIPYQSAAGSTLFTNTGTTGQILQSNGASGPTWVTNTSGAFTLGSTSVTSGSTITTVAGIRTLGFAGGGAAIGSGAPCIYFSPSYLTFVGTGNGYQFKNNANTTTLLTIADSGAATFNTTVTAASFAGAGTGLTSIPNAALTGGGSITIGSASVALGGTLSSLTGITTMSGLTSVTSSTFHGNLIGAVGQSGASTGNFTTITGSFNGSVGGTTPSTGNFTSITVTPGNINGTLAGNCTGSAATVSNAAQPTITSVGTLISLNVSGNATFTGTTTVSGAEVGAKVLPQVIKSVDYTTVLTDSGKHILHPVSDTPTRTYTIDSNANVPYPIGTALTFINQYGAGTVTIGITSDVMRMAGSELVGTRTLAANGIATAIKITATEWIISGIRLT